MGHLYAGLFCIFIGLLNLYFWHDLEIRKVKREFSIQRRVALESITKSLEEWR
jgi:hypothetical protein